MSPVDGQLYYPDGLVLRQTDTLYWTQCEIRRGRRTWYLAPKTHVSEAPRSHGKASTRRMAVSKESAEGGHSTLPGRLEYWVTDLIRTSTQSTSWY